MSDSGGCGQSNDPSETLAALREQGADRFDPVRFRFLDALARRSSVHDGDARSLLDRRLAKLLSDYQQDFAKSGVGLSGLDGGEEPRSRGPLADLLGHIARHSTEHQGSGPPGELKTLTEFRSTWSKLSIDRRLTQSVAKVPEKAGPLNSQVLALRSLELMRDISPAYLRHFMSYVDALLWLDQANGGGPVLKDVVRSDGERQRKTSRKKAG